MAGTFRKRKVRETSKAAKEASGFGGVFKRLKAGLKQAATGKTKAEMKKKKRR